MLGPNPKAFLGLCDRSFSGPVWTCSSKSALVFSGFEVSELSATSGGRGEATEHVTCRMKGVKLCHSRPGPQ
jgi:hypothetical protein